MTWARAAGRPGLCRRRGNDANMVRYMPGGCAIRSGGGAVRPRSGIGHRGGSLLEGSARRRGGSRPDRVADRVPPPRRRGHQCARRRCRDRSDRRGRAPDHRRRPHPDFDRARQRRHRAPHRGAGARGRHRLGRVRACQFERRADRSPHRGAALPDGRLENPVARSRTVPHRQHHAERRRSARPPGQRHRGHFPHHPRPRHRDHLRGRDCAPASCRRSICGSRTPTRTRSTASPCIMASSSALRACWRCS